MAIIAFVGKQGAGKSYLMVKECLKRANKQRKFIVTNQPLNLPYMAAWAKARRLHWLHYLATSGGIVQVPNDGGMLERILSFRNAVIMLDEAQVFLNRRFTNELPKQFLIDIAQQRKIANDLLWCAQDYERVDQNIRSMTQVVYEAQRWEQYILAPGYDDRTYERIRSGVQVPFIRAVVDFRWALVTSSFGGLYDTYTRLEDSNNRGRSVLHESRPFEKDAHTLEMEALERHMSLGEAMHRFAGDVGRKGGGVGGFTPLPPTFAPPRCEYEPAHS